MTEKRMKDELRKPARRTPRLFDRVAAILEEARGSVVRTVNTRMVIAYWLIGRDIVQEEQGGKRRAGYGDALPEDLSRRLTVRYGKGYSVSNLRDFRQFHHIYADRLPPIFHTTRGESARSAEGQTEIHHTSCGEFTDVPSRLIRHETRGELIGRKKSHRSCGDSPQPAVGTSVPAKNQVAQFARQRLANSPSSLHCGFAPQLSWSHYRLMMRVENLVQHDSQNGNKSCKRFCDMGTLSCG